MLGSLLILGILFRFNVKRFLVDKNPELETELSFLLGVEIGLSTLVGVLFRIGVDSLEDDGPTPTGVATC